MFCTFVTKVWELLWKLNLEIRENIFYIGVERCVLSRKQCSIQISILHT